MDSTTGLLAGTPASTGTFTFTVTLFSGGTATKSFALTISPPVTINTTALPDARVGVPYSYQVPASGGNGTLTYAEVLDIGPLPAGLTISSTGLISGTPLGPPNADAPPRVGLSAQDQTTPSPSTAIVGLPLRVFPPTLQFVASSPLPNGVQGTGYSYAFGTSVFGGVPPYFYSAAGNLPPGLSLNSGTGQLSGTIASTAAPGPYNFNVTVIDSGSTLTVQSVTKSFVLNVKTPLVVTTNTLPDGVVGQSYSAALAATGGDQPTSYTLASGTLPPGVTLNPNGTFTGPPTTAGVFNFVVNATDSGVPNSQTVTKALSIRVNQPLTFTTASPLTNATVNVNYSTSIGTSGGTGFVFEQIVTTCTGGPGNGLPPGITFSSGALFGTPTTAGAYSFCVQASDQSAPTQTISKLYQLTVQPPLAITTTSLPGGVVSQSYSQQIATSGGVAPINFTLTSLGPLPPGLTLSSSGLISGSPTTAGTYNFGVQATDASTPTAQTVTRNFQITIQPLLRFTQTTLPAGVVGSAYSVSPLITGGVLPYNVTITTGSLPPGLSISSTGNLAGTPATAGNYSFAVQAVDTGSPAQTITNTFALVVNPALTITTNSPLLPALRTIPYNGVIAANGGIQPYNFQVTGGSLPPGLTLSSNGQISGTATQLGQYSFTVTATDSYSIAPNSVSKQFTIGAYDPITFSPTSLPGGMVSNVYNVRITASGGTSPYQFSIIQGTLPPGLTLSSAGQITGVPLPGTTTSTTTYSFRVRAVDSTNNPVNLSGNQDYSITIVPLTLSFSVGTLLPQGTAGRPYTTQIATVGGTPPIYFSLSSGALPQGLTLDPATGLITGTPSLPGLSTFTITAHDSANPATTIQTISQTFSLNILPFRADLQISANTTLPEGTVDLPYSAGISASGGQPPYTFRQNTGSMPDGLTLNSDGSISGTPKKAGTFTFGVLVGDTSNVSFSGAFFTIKVNPAPIVVSGGLPNGIIGQPYSGSVSATGGVPPFRFSIAGLPPGVTQNLQNVSGTPTTAGTYTVTVVATDSTGAQTTKTFTVVISSTLRLTTVSIPDGVVGQLYSVGFSATGGTPPYTFAIAGTVPDGLAIDSAKGTISGTPTAAGAINVAVQVTDQTGQTDSHNFTANITSTLTITTNGPLPSGTVNQPYSGSVAASGGTQPYTFSGGGVGLTVAANGSISGTPTQAGDFSINATVTDKNGLTASKSLAITIKDSAAPLSVSGSVGAGVVGTAYAGSISASGGTPPYSFSIMNGSMPPGVQFSGGSLSGTPTAAGTFGFTVQATDSAGQTATADFTATISLPPTPPVTISGPAAAVQPQQQPAVGVNIDSPFPVPITGTMTMTFTPDVVNSSGGSDPAVQFATGGQTVNFTIPAGQTQAIFPVNNLQIQTGTTAGTITLKVTLQASGTTLTPPTVPDRTIQIARSAPVISSIKVTRTSTGFTLDITGFSTPRELINGAFTFTAAPGSTLQTTTVTVPLADTMSTFYRSSASQPFGSQFTITMPFNVTQGAANSITGVTVTLTNSVGASAPATASF